MKKLIVTILMLCVLMAGQTQIDINSRTKGNLLGNRLGTAPYVTLSSSCNTTTTWNLNSQLIYNAKITTTGACHLNLTNPVNGGSYILVMTHGAAGSMTLGTGCTWLISNSGGGAITQSAGTNAIDVLTFSYDGTNCYGNFNTSFN